MAKVMVNTIKGPRSIIRYVQDVATEYYQIKNLKSKIKILKTHLEKKLKNWKVLHLKNKRMEQYG